MVTRALATPRRGTFALADGFVNYVFHAAPPKPAGPPVILFGGIV